MPPWPALLSRLQKRGWGPSRDTVFRQIPCNDPTSMSNRCLISSQIIQPQTELVLSGFISVLERPVNSWHQQIHEEITYCA